MSRNGKVIVAMSGGVDSSVAACLLQEQGYECVGVFMRVGAGLSEPEAQARAPVPAVASQPARRLKHGCCSVADALDARAIANRLGISFYALNFEADFGHIIDYFVNEYAAARTPNPCVLCNAQLKFGKLLRYADMLDAEFVATGHYARVLRGRVPLLLEQCGAAPSDSTGNTADTAVPHEIRDTADTALPPGPTAQEAVARGVFLARSLNLAKDQSYVLFGIRRDDLRRCLFPVGEIADKAEVRRIAADLGLKVHDKPDSQEICFVPDGDYQELVRARRPDTERPGEIHDPQGRLLGMHAGVANFTIGQRHGLGLATGAPIYVSRLDAASNTVTVGPREELLSGGLIAERMNWLTDPPPAGEWRPVTIKIRHMHTPAPGRIRVACDTGVPPVSVAAGLCTGRSEPGAVATGPGAGAVVEAHFGAPQSAVTPGQAAVFYAGDIVLGGGWIVRAL